MNGNRSEIVRRCFVNMVRLHHCWSASCASNDEFGANRPPVTRSRRRENDHQLPLTPTIAAVPILRLGRWTAQMRHLHPAFLRFPMDRQPTQVSTIPSNSHYLIVKGMMRSLANVHCELFVPPPNGVVLFKDASSRISGRITRPSITFGTGGLM